MLGKNKEGTTATCNEVLAALGEAAKLLEETFSHLKLCSGLLRGSK